MIKDSKTKKIIFLSIKLSLKEVIEKIIIILYIAKNR